MNCGLTNLESLRKHLLASTMAGERGFDNVITDIGQGVAALIEAGINRDLGYLADAEILFTGDREHYVVPRYPLVSVKSVQMRYFDSQPWQDISGQPIRTNAKSGIVYFGGTLGTEALQVRMVWTGGYWWETLEPEEEGYPSVMPTGATALPNDLRAAFLLQCRAVWQLIDKLGTDLLKSESGAAATLQSMTMIPMVKQMLNEYTRYQLS
jgi:hypothetical protein